MRKSSRFKDRSARRSPPVTRSPTDRGPFRTPRPPGKGRAGGSPPPIQSGPDDAGLRTGVDRPARFFPPHRWIRHRSPGVRERAIRRPCAERRIFPFAGNGWSGHGGLPDKVAARHGSPRAVRRRRRLSTLWRNRPFLGRIHLPGRPGHDPCGSPALRRWRFRA